MPFDQIANPLPDDPVVSWNRLARLLEVTQQLGARATDIVSFLRNLAVLKPRLPLAESSNDETPIRRSDVESRKHLPAASLEPGLEIVRSMGDVARIDERLPVLNRRFMEITLRERLGWERANRCQREREAERFVAHDE